MLSQKLPTCPVCESTNVTFLGSTIICGECNTVTETTPTAKYLEEGHDIEMGGHSYDIESHDE